MSNLNVQYLGKGLLRQAKQYTKGYSDTQIKVRDATKNDPWGPSGLQMNEVAALTYNSNDFIEVIEMLDKRLNDKGKNWRHVYKSLIVVEYLLQAGSENVVLYFKDNAYLIKTLKEFQYIDEDGKDQGLNIRQKAKELTLLLLDDARLRSLRRGLGGRGPSRDDYEDDFEPAVPARPRGDDDMQRSIDASRRAADEQRRLKDQDDANLAEAMRLSLEDEERRKRALAAQSNSLFDDFARDEPNSLIDLDSPAVLVPNMTSYANYNPYAAQQQQQQQEWLAQQQLLAQQQAAMEQQRQLEQQQQWLAQQQQLLAQQTGLRPQFTASYQSNNPFAPAGVSAQPTGLAAQPTGLAAQPTGLSAQPTGPPPVPSPPRPTRVTGDAKHPDLAQLLANGPGVDTFGNTGDLRVPMGSQFATKPNPFN